MVDMRIHFDEINLSAGMVGAANGLTHSEIKQHTAKALDALRSFRKSSEDGLYGFPLLPFQSQFAKEILAYAGQMRGFYDTVCLVGIGGSALGSWAVGLHGRDGGGVSDCAGLAAAPARPQSLPADRRGHLA
jgi:hypothetical protein